MRKWPTLLRCSAQAGTLARPARPDLDRGLHPSTAFVFIGLLAAGVLFVAYSLYSDVAASGAKTTTFLPYLLLFVALLTALGFEFVNGFHDTANAVATVIYTHSLPAQIAVVWSGSFNFLGVLLSSGAVAFGIISLLPVELILQVGSAAGFAMVFALLIAAVIWNLGTWFLGLPVSSSHSLIGSIIGVGVANALARGQDGTSRCRLGAGDGRRQGAAVLARRRLHCVGASAAGYESPDPSARIVPCAGERSTAAGVDSEVCWSLLAPAVSFAHGSNDGQKGMGLIMLILIGTVPTTYALNRALPDSQLASFRITSAAASDVIEERPPATTFSATRVPP